MSLAVSNVCLATWMFDCREARYDEDSVCDAGGHSCIISKDFSGAVFVWPYEEDESEGGGVTYYGTICDYINFQGSSIVGKTSVKGAVTIDTAGANLSGTHLIGSNTGASVTATFDTSFLNADFSGVSFYGGESASPVVTDGYYKDVILAGSKFVGVDISGSSFKGVDFSVIEGATVVDTDNKASLRAVGSDLTDANFTGVNLDHAAFEDTILTRANFSDASLEEAKFNNVDLMPDDNKVGVNFSGATMIRTSFINSDLAGVDFSGVNLADSSFNNSNLKYVKFSQESNLNGVNIYCSDVYEADFSDTGVTAASMAYAKNCEYAIGIDKDEICPDDETEKANDAECRRVFGGKVGLGATDW